MRAEEFPEVRALELFNSMSVEAFNSLIEGGYVQIFPPAMDLIREGDPSDFLYVLLEGAVEMFATWNDNETIMEMLEPVTTFIPAASVRNKPYLMSARTIEKSRLLMIRSENIRQVFDEDVGFARAMVAELGRAYRRVVKRTKDLKLRSSVVQLANYLIHEDDVRGGGQGFELRTEKRRLASYLGMSPENLSRAFNSLKPYGVVVEGNRIRLTNRKDLETLAKPSPLIDDPDV